MKEKNARFLQKFLEHNPKDSCIFVPAKPVEQVWYAAVV